MYKEFLNNFKINNPDKQIILLYEAGSHFFDLNGPNSDRDYRGVYIGYKQDSFQSKIGKIDQTDYKTNTSGGKNSKEDIDFTMFSLSTMLELIKCGDFNLIEALYAPENKIIYRTPIYDELRNFRKNLVHNDISAFLGFIRREANRVGVNSHHYEVQVNFLKLLEGRHPHIRLNTFWDEIKAFCEDEKNIGAKISRTAICNSDLNKEIPTIVIAARMHQWTASVSYVKDSINHIISKYGHRQKSTAEVGGDYKTLYHSLRLIYEANDILDYGELRFPFSQEVHQKLMEIKNGITEPDELYIIINDEIEKLIKKSNSIISNKKEYEHKLDTMIFTLKGRLEIENIRRNGSKEV